MIGMLLKHSTPATGFNNTDNMLVSQEDKATRDEKWDLARKAVQDVVDLQTRRFGPQHWQTTTRWQTLSRTSGAHSTTCARGPASRALPATRCPFAGTTAAESLQPAHVYLQKTSFAGTLAPAPNDTCTPTSRGQDSSNLSFSILPDPSGPSSGRIFSYSRRKRQSLYGSHRQSRWINFDLDGLRLPPADSP